MDIRHLQYLQEVARHGSFTKAAEALHITQPTISKMIKNLEEELGLEVFVRSGKRVELTDVGQTIYAHAGDILKSFNSLSAELADMTGLKKGRIRLGMPPMVGASFFPGVMGLFRRQYPGIEIQMFEDGSKKIEASVADGVLEMGVVLLPTDEELFDSFVFVRERLLLVVSSAHPLADREQVALSVLSTESFILFSEDFALHGHILEACRHAGFEPQVMYKSSQWDFISEMVAAGLGIAMLPETICASLDRERLRTIPIGEPVIPWELAMIWPKDRYLSFAAREWIRFTRSMLESNLKV